MDWIEDTLNEYGHSLGLRDLRLDANGHLELPLRGDDLLCIDHVPLDIHANRPPHIRLACYRQLAWNRPNQLRSALRCVDFRLAGDWPAQVSIDRDRLVFNLRIPERAFVQNVLQEAVRQLQQMHDDVG
jgi:hypothetical protein